MSRSIATRLPTIVLATILTLSLTAFVAMSRADEHGEHSYPYREYEFREHEFHQSEFLDSRYHHDHYYPPAGFAFGALPPGHIVVRHQGASFYFSGGVWYSAVAPGRFVVVAPPVGLIVPVLPPVFTTVWVGGVPYYYANNTYYVRSPQGYVIVSPPPPTAVVVEAPPGNAPVQRPPVVASYHTPLAPVSMYPNRGQSPDQQAQDRYACHRWAVGQSGYDPTLPNGPGATEQQMDGYRRAMTACLDARGYTVW